MSKHVIVHMSSNSETFELESRLSWQSVTLERCDIVNMNGGSFYTIYIEEIPDELLICENGTSKNSVGTFCVGSEPFNHTEHHAINNYNPGKPLNRLTINVYNDSDGNLASIFRQFHLRIRVDAA